MCNQIICSSWLAVFLHVYVRAITCVFDIIDNILKLNIGRPTSGK